MKKNKSLVLLLTGAVSLVACQSSAPPVAPPLPDADAPGAQVLRARCTQCHGAPAPSTHSAEEWPGVVERMNMHRLKKAYNGITDDERATLLAYLRANARTESAR